jgi:hypothetical protein
LFNIARLKINIIDFGASMDDGFENFQGGSDGYAGRWVCLLHSYLISIVWRERVGRDGAKSARKRREREKILIL